MSVFWGEVRWAWVGGKRTLLHKTFEKLTIYVPLPWFFFVCFLVPSKSQKRREASRLACPCLVYKD